MLKITRITKYINLDLILLTTLNISLFLNNNIIIADKRGNLYYSGIDDFLNNNNSFKKIKSNLNFVGVTDLYIKKNSIYVSGYKK